MTPADAKQLIPTLIPNQGNQVAWRYIEFFICNPATRTYAGLMRGPANNADHVPAV
jgi:hypothetical protein